jgi:hypothetical protein
LTAKMNVVCIEGQPRDRVGKHKYLPTSIKSFRKIILLAALHRRSTIRRPYQCCCSRVEVLPWLLAVSGG